MSPKRHTVPTIDRSTPAPINVETFPSSPGQALVPSDITASPQTLSPSAQQALQMSMSLFDSRAPRHPRSAIRANMTAVELASVLYAAAAQYYTHPEFGRLPTQWSSLESALRGCFPDLIDPASRRNGVCKLVYREALQTLNELMFWSGHLAGSFQLSHASPASVSHLRWYESITRPLRWAGLFLIALILGLSD